MKKQSPVMELVHRIYVESFHTGRPSYDRRNAAEHAAHRLVVRYDVQFDRDDFKSSLLWPNIEGLYAIACGCERSCGNRSACLAFEAGLKRKPFLVRQPSEKTPKRVYVGREFRWYGEQVVCTSFAESGEHLVACAYDPAAGYRSKVARRIKITHAAIQEYHALLKLHNEPEATGATGSGDGSAREKGRDGVTRRSRSSQRAQR